MSTFKNTGVAQHRSPLPKLAALGFAVLLMVPSIASAQVFLGTAQDFGVLAGPTVTNTGPSAVAGNVGTSPGNAIVGFPPGTATGVLHAGNAIAAAAQVDLTTGYNAAAGTACTTTLAPGSDLGGLTLVPGVYCFATASQLTGNLTLDFLGNPNSSFLFKSGSTLTTASNSSVLAINTGGAGCLQNINWQVGSSATLGTNSNFAGNILADQSITLTTGANLRGRALARIGAVTLDSNLNVGGCPAAASVPGGPIPPPGAGTIVSIPTLQEWALILLAMMLAGVGGWQVRRKASIR